MSPYTWLLLLLLAVAFLLRVDFIYYILYVVVGVYLWSRWYTPRALRGLYVSRSFPRCAFLGETAEVTITLENKNRLPVPWIQFHESVAPELHLKENLRQAVSLGGRSSTQFHYSVRGLQRGYYRLGPMRLTIGDLFGLVDSQSGFLKPDHLTVYPRIIALNQLGLPSRLPFGTLPAHRRLFEDAARPMGVRDFRSGDSLRQINWKASAHTQKMLVRTFQPAISLETAIILDLDSSAYERRERFFYTEWAIVVAASLAAHLTNERQAVGLITNGIDPLRLQEDQRDYDEATGRLKSHADSSSEINRHLIPAPIPPHTGRPHLMKILEQLARIETRATIPFQAWATQACMDLSWGVTVIAITNRGDEPACNAMHRLARSGFNPILITVEPDANFGLVRERARHLGFQAFNITDDHSLDHWRQPQRSAFSMEPSI